MNDNLKYTLRFLIFLAVQLLLFQNLNLGTYLAPMPYILFLLLFPCTYSTVLLMLWAFAFGLTLDVLGAGIMGLHTASFVVAGALRSTILKTVTVKGDLDNLMVPGFNQLGFGRYSIFVVLCVMAHHLVFFTLESLSFFLFWQTFARFLCSLLLNVFLILLFKKLFLSAGGSIMENRARQRSIIVAFFIICMIILAGRLVFLQLINKEYKITASNNVLRYEIIYPSRGLIYDRNGNTMVENQFAYDILITPRELVSFDTTAFCSIFNLDRERLEQMLEEVHSRRRTIGYQSVIFLRQVSNQEYTRFLEKSYKFQGFSVQTRSVRSYPSEICGNLPGYIIEADQSFLDSNPEYRPGDYIGRTGLEEFYEKWLRGEKGYSIFLRDVHNRIKSSYEDGAYDKTAVPGKDMVTTIDLDLQRFGEELMRNKVGSVVALDPSNGEVLTLITSTGLSSQYLTNFGSYYPQVIADPLKPLFNRAIMSAYPPGSVFKLVNGLIGLQEGVLKPETRYSCKMGYHAGSLTVGCHSHPSPINLVQSVMMSCNAYYCNVLRSILDNPAYGSIGESMNKWQEYVKSFGFGTRLGIDIPGELSGSLPGTALYDKIYGAGRWRSLTVISLSIGQGEIGATPLQLANLAAIMANRGHYYTPHLVREIREEPSFSPRVERHQVMVAPENFEVIVEGMYQAVNAPAGSGATARLAAIPDVVLCGKTGTAQNPHGEDNSVFICFAPKDDPKIAVAVYIEQGGFGASQAAPVASLLVEKYLTGEIHPSRQWLYERTLEQDLLTRHLQ